MDIQQSSASRVPEAGWPSLQGGELPPPGAENVKIQENSEKNQGTSGGPSTTVFRTFIAISNNQNKIFNI